MKPDAKMTFSELTKWHLGLKRVKCLASYGTAKK